MKDLNKTAKQLATNEMACTKVAIRKTLGGLINAEGTRDTNILFLQNDTIENKKFSDVSNKELPPVLWNELNVTLMSDWFSNIVKNETLECEKIGYTCKLSDLDDNLTVRKEVIARKNGEAIWEHIQVVRKKYRQFRDTRLREWRKRAVTLESIGNDESGKKETAKKTYTFIERLIKMMQEDDHSASFRLKLINRWGKDCEQQKIYDLATETFLATLVDSGKFKEAKK
tara:strand:+ start:1140 stop:1823 length:684 start_codon:yes stop_codon:yes gene_type:complete